MTSWQIIKKLFRGSNFYWRKFFIFAIFLFVGSFAYLLLINNSQTEASIKLAKTEPIKNPYQVNLKVEISPNGKITTNGKDISKALSILPDKYEIKIIAFDNPGQYIYRFKAEIVLPQKVSANQIQQIVYAVHGVGSYKYRYDGDRTLIYEINDISPAATVTVAAYLPKTAFKPPFIKQILYQISQIPVNEYLTIALVLPVITFLTLLFMLLKRERERFLFNFVGEEAQVPPMHLTPAVAGVLYDGQISSREIAATLIDLANRGYLYITRKGDTFCFGKRKSLQIDQMTELTEGERFLLSKIFQPQCYKSTDKDVAQRVGNHIFSRKIAMFYLECYNEATDLGFFVKNPAKVHLSWKYAGITMLLLGFLGFMLNAFWGGDQKYTLIFWVGMMLVSLVIIRLSGLMPARTKYGMGALLEWVAFKNYLKSAKPMEAGKNNKDLFIRYLPYAIVFGVEADWAKRFFKERFYNPQWYESMENTVTLESFIAGLYPIISYVGQTLAKSHEPTVE